ncbi:MAG: InlB B-repeat-containing protein [Actinomycetota bacterium]
MTTTTVAPTTYSVIYNGNTSTSGAVPTDVGAYTMSSTVTVLGNTGNLAKPGYAFAGWCTTQPAAGSACTGTVHAAASTFSITADTTLYAQWTANTLTVTYDSQSGSAISSGSTTTGGSIAASPGTPTRAGHTFAGWFEASSGGSAITFPYTHGRTANFTLFAQWTVNTQTISYAAGTGGSGSAPSSPTTVSYGSTFTTPANTYTRTGYSFAGWSDGSSTYAAGVTYPASGTVSGNVTLTATWVATCANGGTCVVGDIGPGGGTVFYVHASGTFACGETLAVTCRYLEAAPTSGTSAWVYAAYAWAPNGVLVGTVGDLGAGLKNTVAMVASDGTAARAGSAARAYRGPNNLDDWHLASKDELNEMCKWARNTGQVAGAATTCTGGVSSIGRIPRYSNMWSSTDSAASQAIQQNFFNGSTSAQAKGATYWVHPVRAFG